MSMQEILERIREILSPDFWQAVSAVASAIASIATVVLLFVAYRFTRQQQQESWLRTFQEMHKAFWDEPKMQRIRTWIACDSAYQKQLLPILVKRLLIKEPEINLTAAEYQLVGLTANDLELTADDYQLIDDLDTFLNLVIRVDALVRELKLLRDIEETWKQLSLDWWLREFVQKRPGLIWYSATFYKYNLKDWSQIVENAPPHHTPGQNPVEVAGEAVFTKVLKASDAGEDAS